LSIGGFGLRGRQFPFLLTVSVALKRSFAALQSTAKPVSPAAPVGIGGHGFFDLLFSGAQKNGTVGMANVSPTILVTSSAPSNHDRDIFLAAMTASFRGAFLGPIARVVFSNSIVMTVFYMESRR